MHICIIGACGVGKAHALSAAQWLVDNVTDADDRKITLVDYEIPLKQNFGQLITTWRNSWGPISDEFSICNEFGDMWVDVKRLAIDNLAITDINEYLQNIDADLYIIATPDNFHKGYIKALYGKQVLCEKPIVGPNQSINTSLMKNLHLGIEWLYHPALEEIKTVTSIDFIHGYPPEAAMWDWNHHIYDLGSHVVSIYQHLLGVDKFKAVKIERDCRVTSIWTDEGVCLRFGYKRGVTDDVVVINHKHKLEWVPFNDRDLFYRQINHILTDGVPLLTPEQIFEGNHILSGVTL